MVYALLKVFYPVNGIVSDKVRDISMFLDSVIVLCDEIRIVIVALSGDNLPVIKTGRQTFKMPFTYQCCLITDFLQQFRKSLPSGLDYWQIVPGQGDYYNPDFITQNNDTIQNHVHVLHNAHLLRGSGGTSFIIVKEIIR